MSLRSGYRVSQDSSRVCLNKGSSMVVMVVVRFIYLLHFTLQLRERRSNWGFQYGMDDVSMLLHVYQILLSCFILTSAHS